MSGERGGFNEISDEQLRHVLKAQTKQVQYLMKRVDVLEKKNAVLQAALNRQTIEAGKSFQELRGQFDKLAEQIYDIILYWVKKLQRPLTYDEIIKYYRAKYPRMPYQSETLTRRVRELAEGKIAGKKWLHSPRRGLFVPVADEVKA